MVACKDVKILLHKRDADELIVLMRNVLYLAKPECDELQSSDDNLECVELQPRAKAPFDTDRLAAGLSKRQLMC